MLPANKKKKASCACETTRTERNEAFRVRLMEQKHRDDRGVGEGLGTASPGGKRDLKGREGTGGWGRAGRGSGSERPTHS